MNNKLTIYAMLGGLTAAQAYIASGALPKILGPVVGIAAGVLLAIKAYQSTPPPKS